MDGKTIKLNYSTGICTVILLLFVIVISTVFRIPHGVSLAFTVSFAVLAIMAIQYIAAYPLSVVTMFLLMLSFFSVVVNALVSRQAQIGFSYFKKLIMFDCTLIFFSTAVDMKVERSARRLLVCAPLLMGVLLCVSYYFLGNRGMIAHSITLGFTNPNFTGIWLTHLLFYAVYAVSRVKRRVTRAALLALAAVLTYLIYKTFARSCFFGIAAYALMLLSGLLTRKTKLNRAILLGVAILPIFFAFFYLAVVQTRWFTDAFSFLVAAGKKLNARNKLWLLAFASARGHLLLGNYSGISDGLGTSQLHNTHIDVLCSYGLPSLVLFVAFLYECMDKVNERVQSLPQYLAFCAFIGCLCIGCLEASLVAGSTGLYFLTGGFLILAADNGEEDDSSALPLRHDHG